MSDPTFTRSSPTPGVAHFQLTDPERRNPLGHRLLDELEAAVYSDGLGAVVLSAAAGPAFSAGGDLDLPPAELEVLSDRVFRLCSAIQDHPTVFIVAADGIIVGGGAQLFLAADLRVVGPAASLRAASPERRLVVGTWSLPCLVGRGRALDLLLTGRPLGDAELVQWGLADRAASDPTEVALALAQQVVSADESFRSRVKRAVAAACRSAAALEIERSTSVLPIAKRSRP